MNDFPAPGAYGIEDPHRPGISYWVVGEKGLTPFPLTAKYGPQRPARNAPGTSVELRRDQVRWWKGQVEEYRLEVLKRIAADPAAAAAKWTKGTERCSACRALFRAGELEDSAAAVEEPLTGEQRDAMAVALRRAGHPEQVIAAALGMSPTRVNRVARRAGIGAPLRPKNGDRT